MMGAIVGDIVGSKYEFNPIKTKDFEIAGEGFYFTDDTVLTVATMDCLLNKLDYGQTYKKYALKYPDCGYGINFGNWAVSESMEPYNSFGNGSAMRVSPIAWTFESIEMTRIEAKRSAEVSHNHIEGIKGAEAVASSVFMAINNKTKKEIKEYVEKNFGYDLSSTLDEIRPNYQYDITCQGSVPQSIMCFLESVDFEDSIRNAISLGGDADTMASISGAIAEAYYKKIPDDLIRFAKSKLDKNLLDLVEKFYEHIS